MEFCQWQFPVWQLELYFFCICVCLWFLKCVLCQTLSVPWPMSYFCIAAYRILKAESSRWGLHLGMTHGLRIKGHSWCSMANFFANLVLDIGLYVVPVTVMCLAFVLWCLFWAVDEEADEEAAGDVRNEMRWNAKQTLVKMWEWILNCHFAASHLFFFPPLTQCFGDFMQL